MVNYIKYALYIAQYLYEYRALKHTHAHCTLHSAQYCSILPKGALVSFFSYGFQLSRAKSGAINDDKGILSILQYI